MGDLSSIMDWKPIETAPFDRDLELAVIGSSVAHRIAFPCRRVTGDGWLDAETNKRVYYIRPTHWRDWSLN
jgi:hypothetical protein